MRVRVVVPALLALAWAGAAEAQVPRRVEPKAFTFSVTPFAGIGWGGVRGEGPDTAICATTNCVKRKVGSGPVVGLDFQIPIAGTVGLGLAGSWSRASRVTCAIQCFSPDRLTVLHGSAMILWRFKARAPIYFGIGPTLSYIDPGAVETQPSSVKEYGGTLVIAYDFQFSPRVGGRVAWWNHVVQPSEDGFNDINKIQSPGLTWDRQISVGVTIGAAR